MSECRWIGCTNPPRGRGLCQRHHGRTMRAGRRAARGAPREDVLQAIHQADFADVPIRDRLEDLEFLITVGEWPDRAAHRCGWTVESALGAARRNNRPIIARALDRSRP